MDAKFEKHINLMNVVRTTTGSSYTQTVDRNPIFYWDADAYSNVVAIYFEAVMRAASGDTAYMILSEVDPVGGTSDITGSEISTTSTTNVLVRSGDIKANISDNTDWLMARWKRTGSGTASFDCARLIIVQQGAVTKTETVIELGEDNNVPSTSYSAPTDYAIFQFDSARFNGTFNAFFEATLHCNSSGNTTYAQLYDITAGAAVSGSEVSHTGNTNKTRKRTASAITLVDGHEYRIDIKGSSTSDDVLSAGLVLQQTGTPTKTDCYIPLLNTLSSGTDTSYSYQNRLINWDGASNWQGDTEVYLYEATLKVTANTGYYNLYNDTDAGQIDERTTTSTSYDRDRSTGITMPTDDGNVLNGARKITTSGTCSAARSFVIAQIDWSSGTAYQQECPEVITIVDTALKMPSKVLVDALVLVDTVIKLPSRILSEVVTIVDTVVNQATKVLAETITIVDTVTQAITAKILEEVVTIVDTVLKLPQRVLSEVVTIVDTIESIKLAVKELLETITIVDTITRTISRTYTEVVTIVDTVLKMGIKTFSEVVTLVDVFERSITKVLVEVVTLVDTVVFTTSRVISEVITIVDTVLKQASRTLSEIIPIEDLVTAAKVGTQELLETITIVDSIVRTVERTLSEVVTIVDTIIKIPARVFSEVVEIVDSVVKTGIKIFAEVVTLVDTFVSVATLYKTLEEVVTIVDTFTSIFAKTFEETVTLVETFVKTTVRTFDEVVTLVDNFIKTSIKTLAETVTLVDTFEQLKFVARTFTETISLNEIFRAIKNGLLVGIWAKVVKTVASWTKQTKTSATWTKDEKPTAEWDKQDKPYH